MVNRLSSDERTALDLILEDLKNLFQIDEISESEIDRVMGQLKSEEVKAYLRHLRVGSKPEYALREAFFAGRSILSKYLADIINPEVNLGNGFIDYQIGSGGRFILLELKSLFEAEVVQGKAGRELKGLKQRPLKWENHKEQILKYIRDGGKYIILTNLKEWCFFNDECSPDRCEPFYTTELFAFLNDFEVSPNLYERLGRYDLESIREALDKRFFESLEAWVNKLSEVKFDVNDERKLELIISLINRFVFIQTLDDYGVVDFRWIKNAWDHAVQMWSAKGKLQVLKEFFREVLEWFYEYYDTELFKNDVLKYLKQDSTNIDLFYKNLELVLGSAYWQTPLGGFKGIMQYNFKFINEDIFGKAYETYLAKVRKEQGIYYTPSYITEYIVENTIGQILDELLREIKRELKAGNFEAVPPLIERFKSIHLLDPACGSGSFLVKAERKIFEKYHELFSVLYTTLSEFNQYNGTLLRPKEVEEKADKLIHMRETVVEKSNRELICKILVRHIHGCDLDPKALQVAKVNLWLEAIKLSPTEFRYDQLPRETNHILPDLEMNLRNGDSLVGLPDDIVITFLRDGYKDVVTRISDLRQQYLSNPTDPSLVQQIEQTKQELRTVLDLEFRKFVERKQLPSEILNRTLPIHYPFEFWYFYFDGQGNPLPEDARGVNVVIGNPPYVENKHLDKIIKTYLQGCGEFISAYKLFDYAVPFVERAYHTLKSGGYFGYIITNKFTVTDYGVKIRDFLLNNVQLSQLIDVSYLPVFKGTSIYPLIMIFIKQPPVPGFEVKVASRVSSELEIVNAQFKSLQLVSQSIFKETPSLIFDLSGRALLSTKIRNKATHELRDVTKIGYRLLKFSGWDELLRFVSSQATDDSLKFIGCGNIEPYYIDWSEELRLAGRRFANNYLQKPSTARHDKWQIFIKPKILVREIGIRLTAAYDQKGEYGNLTGVYILYDVDKDFDLRYLTALLNSAVLNFYYRSLYGSTHMAGGYLTFHGSYISNLPIVQASPAKQEQIGDMVSLVMKLKQDYKKLFESWRLQCARLKSNELSLHEIIRQDQNLLHEGQFESTWTTEVSFYPDDNEVLDRIFDELTVESSTNSLMMRIVGTKSFDVTEEIYSIRFNSKYLFWHVYLCLVDTLASRLKIKKLRQLLQKTSVPVIRPNISIKTPNILNNVFRELGQEYDPVKIYKEIEETMAKIDAAVFELYGLSLSEAEIIMNELELPISYRQKVLNSYSSYFA